MKLTLGVTKKDHDRNDLFDLSLINQALPGKVHEISDGHWRYPTNLFDMRMHHMPMPRLRKVLLQVSGILFVLIMWELTTGVLGIFKWIVLPPPTDVFMATVAMV